MRAAVDTNVWTRAFLNVLGPAGRVVTAFYEGRFTLLTSEPLLEEIADVLSRPRVVRKHGRSPDQRAAFVDGLRDGAEVVSLPGTIHVCRDPDDNALIETAERGGAACLVSEDQDLHAAEVKEYLAALGIRVLTVQGFLTALDEQSAAESP